MNELQSSAPDPRPLPVSQTADASWGDGPPDPLAYPDLYDGIIARRCIAFLIDQIIVAVLSAMTWMVLAVLQILTLGLLAPTPAIGLSVLFGLAYYTLFLGHAGQSLGMRWQELELRRQDGGRASYAQALARTMLFFFSIAFTAWLILLIAVVNERRRCVHDFLSGTVVVRRAGALDIS